MTFQFLSTFDDCKFSLIYMYIYVLSAYVSSIHNLFTYIHSSNSLFTRAHKHCHILTHEFFLVLDRFRVPSLCILYIYILCVCVCVSIGKGLKSKASKMRRSNRIGGDKMESWNLNEMDQKKTHEEKR